jgi:hypothetical protein
VWPLYLARQSKQEEEAHITFFVKVLVQKEYSLELKLKYSWSPTATFWSLEDYSECSEAAMWKLMEI